MEFLVVCDLDGVVYLDDVAVPGAGEALDRIRAAGHRLLFCTNNAWRTPGQVAEKIRRICGFRAEPDEVLSSAMVAAGLVRSGPVLAVGGEGLRSALADHHLPLTEDPLEAAAVVAGLDLDISYRKLADAATAIRGGAQFVATNLDATFPTDRGLLPGAGSLIAAIQAASGVEPVTAGKPFPPMREAIRVRAEGRPVWVVGDREDTDLEMARIEGWVSVLVLTGVTEHPTGHPDHVLDSVVELPDVLARAGT